METWQIKFCGSSRNGQTIIDKRIGSAPGLAKNAKSKFKHAKATPTRIAINERDSQINENVKIYYHLLSYMYLRAEKHPKAPNQYHFLLTAVASALDFNSFFKIQPVSVSHVQKRITKICDALRIKVIGTRSHVSPHSFRATSLTKLMTSGQSVENVAKRSGHATPKTLTRYFNVLGTIGDQR